MEKHLSKASEAYDIEAKIHPISQLDAEFITIMIDVLEQKGWEDLAEIVKEYKKIPDQDVLDQLAEYSIAIDDDDLDQDQPERKGGKSSPKEFVEIGGERFRTFALFRMKRIDRWDEDSDGPVFSILINEGPLPGSGQWYMDTYVDFESEEERDKEWKASAAKMKKQNCVFL